MRIAWSHAAAALCLVAASAASVAATPGGLFIEPPDSMLGCLERPPAPPPYPVGLAENKLGGTIRVRLSFYSSSEPPRSAVTFAAGGDAFRRAVLEHVASYRLPCLAGGAAPVEAVQEFQFLPGDGRKVHWSVVRDGQADSSRQADCVAGRDRGIRFPGVIGTVLVRLRFDSPSAAPDVAVLYDSSGGRLSNSVRDAVAGYRMTCLTAGAKPVEARQLFRFAWADEPATLLKDAPLSAFVRALADLERHKVRFDFSTMRCPFDVRLVLFQPYARNEVGEIGSSQPDRREFIEWLKGVELALNPRQRSQVVGDSMTISVPCGVLDLT